jgi:PBP1b-binding outer membrane lipoprotein LpoB
MKTLELLKKHWIIIIALTPLIISGCSHKRIDTTDSTRQLILTCEKLRQDIATQAIEEFNSGVCKAHVEIGKDYMLLCQRLQIVRDELK